MNDAARRVGAIALRHYYLVRGSWPRILDLIYWPALQMLLWGFITLFFVENSSWVAQTAGVLLSAALLWDVLFRSQISLFTGFLEEPWSRNLANLLITPLRPAEFMLALAATSLARTLIGVGGAAVLAWLLFDFSLLALGAPLAAFFANLAVLGWAIGLLVSGLVLRFGLGAQGLGWALVFLIQPVSGVFYPVAVLPEWLRPAAWALPSSHLFEGMRAVLVAGTFRADLLANAVALNAVWLTAGVCGFLFLLRRARELGLILQSSE